MVVGFDLLAHSRPLQAHWIRRCLAFLLDLTVVLFPLWYVLRRFELLDPVAVFFLASGPAVYGATVAQEYLFGRTLGKAGLGLEVKSRAPYLHVRQVALRNVPKVFWYIFPLVDALLGLATEGDPRERFLDRLAGTTVVMSWAVEAREAEMKVARSKVTVASGPPCHSCGGPLGDVGDDLLQCRRCGVIQ